MSYNPNRAYQPSHIIPVVESEWSRLISQTIGVGKLPQFPKAQIVEMTQLEGAPKVKQLMGLLQELMKKYMQNCQNFAQLMVVLYLLTLKGCASVNDQFMRISMEFLQQLLKFRILVICRVYSQNCMSQLYGWVDNWLTLFVPAALLSMADSSAKINQVQRAPITFISIIKQLNKAGLPQDNLLLLFQCLLISKLRSHLAPTSLFQFDSILRRIYSAEKYAKVYQGKGCTSHIPHKQTEYEPGQKDIIINNLVRISDLVPAKLHEMSWQIFELQLSLRDKQEGAVKQHSKLMKVQSDCSLQPWVVDCYTRGAKPNPIKINLNTLLLKMKTMQIYRFLCLLEVYGGSPNIEVLNDYILDQKILLLFTKFLVGDNLAEQLLSLLKPGSVQDLSSLGYSYRNQKFMKILDKMASYAAQISDQVEKKLILKQLSSRVLVGDWNFGGMNRTREKEPGDKDRNGERQ